MFKSPSLVPLQVDCDADPILSFQKPHQLFPSKLLKDLSDLANPVLLPLNPIMAALEMLPQWNFLSGNETRRSKTNTRTGKCKAI